MNTLLFVVLLVLIVVLVLLIARANARGWGRGGTGSGMAEREAAYEAQAEVEEGDIEQMIEARNALRKRLGKPSIGDELAEEVQREPPEGP